MTPLRAIVVGVGHLGSRHARVYAELDSVELVGIADIEGERGRKLANELGTRWVGDFRDLLENVDIASVAVPTVSHHEITCALLEASVHVLVEKPMATTEVEASQMIALAERGGRCLAVGHTERYNPAVEALLSASHDPRFIEVHRLGSFSPRSLDIDVVLDLMIHDLDVVSALVKSEVSGVWAVGVPVLTERVDIANARLHFDNGSVANLTASRVSRDKVRKLRVFEPESYTSVDYQEQEATSYRIDRSGGTAALPVIRREDLVVERSEPLKREIGDFVTAVRNGHVPRVSGQDGLRALGLARRIVEEMQRQSARVVRKR